MGAALVLAVVASAGGFKQAAGAPFSVGSSPEYVATGDVNGDGKPDVVVLAYDSGTDASALKTYLGNGAGGFKSAGAPVEVHADAEEPVLGDLNGDHKLDVVVSNYGEDSISVYLGNGTGGFTQHGSEVALHGGSQPDIATIADLNGDNKPDLIVPNSFVAGIDFLQGDGDGGFTAFTGSPFNYSAKYPGDPSALSDGPLRAVAGNFDGDNHIDVAVLNQYAGADQTHGTISILKGAGDGTFTPDSQLTLTGVGEDLALGDLNGDGHADLIAATGDHQVVGYLGDGSGGFTPGLAATLHNPSMLVTGDFNGDKRLDVGTAANDPSNGVVDVALGDGAGNLAAEPGGPFDIGLSNPDFSWIAAADVNLDKRTDLLGANYSLKSVDVLLRQGGALPSASSITPSAELPGQSITIHGSALNTVAFVSFDGADGDITAQSATSLTVTVPNGVTTLGKLLLIGANGAALTGPTFTPIVTPSISSLSPSPGTKAGGTLTINGAHFTGTTAVTFGAVAATKFVVNSDAKITATVPEGAGSSVEVTNPAGDDGTPFALIVAPQILSISPPHGPANKGATTTLFVGGHHLQGVTSVLFHGKPGTNLSVSLNGESLQVDAPVGATTGTISAKNIAGSGTSDQTFTVDPPPMITSFTPAFGPVNSSVTITGKGFLLASGVKFGTFLQTSLTVNSDTSITTTVPGLATIGKLTVITPSGPGVSAATFTAIVPPHIDTLAPSAGIPGTAVTINGSHFTKTTSVTFNGVAATFSVVSDTKITTKMPIGATTGILTVTNAAGSNDSLFTLVVPPALNATGSFTPTAGGANQAVTISGLHFTGVKSVTFNGKPAASFTIDSDNQITAHVAAGSGTGVIKVTNAAGFDATTDKFTLVSITSFSPANVTNDSTLTVNGSGLSAVTKIVFFGTFGTQVSPNPGGTDTKLMFTFGTCGSTGTFHLVVPGAFDVVSATPLTYTGPACT